MFRNFKPPDERLPYPQTVGDARRYIKKTFREQRWNAREREYYMRRHGLRSIDVDRLPADDTRKLLTAMQVSRMILIDEKSKGA